MKKFWQKLNPKAWLEFSSPVTLGFMALSLIALVLGLLTGGRSTRALFSVYKAPMSQVLFYPRLFLHVLGHADFAHFANNMAMFLLLSPMVESRYGSGKTALMFAITALVTGVLHLLFSPYTASLGASGIVFMLILLSAASTRKTSKIPLTLVLVALIYLGQEVLGMFQRDNISQLAHIIGGLCGVGFGLVFPPEKNTNRPV